MQLRPRVQLTAGGGGPPAPARGSEATWDPRAVAPSSPVVGGVAAGTAVFVALALARMLWRVRGVLLGRPAAGAAAGGAGKAQLGR